MAPRKIINLATKTRDEIYAHYKNNAHNEVTTHLRASELGHKCERYIWMKYHWCFDASFDGRMTRLFQTGHLEEERIIKDLEAIGVKVIESQYEVIGLNGKLKGHIDGVAIGVKEDPETPHLFECKTHSLNSFQKLELEGVEKSKPQHYAQMQLYLGLIEPELTKALYVAVCKNSDDIYCEIVKKDTPAFTALLEKAERILDAQEMPAKCSESFEFPPCSWCDYVFYCHQTWPNTSVDAKLPNINCRTCADFGWSCMAGVDASEGCNAHLYNVSLVPFLPQEGDRNDVVYLTLDGKRLRNQGRKFEEVAQ